MGERIKLYRVTVTRAYMMGECGIRWMLAPWLGDPTKLYEGCTDGVAWWDMPDGYAYDADFRAIRDPQGVAVPLETDRDGRPYIVGADGVHMLRRVAGWFGGSMDVIRREVADYLGEWASDFDLDMVADAICERGYTTIDDMDSAEFIGLLEQADNGGGEQ